jgi:hypothetical protein
MEPLQGRDLMSAGFEIAAPRAVGLTAPLGSTKGSAVAEFTPPIGSNKGSVVAGVACDGVGTTQREGSTQGIIAVLIGFNAPTKPGPAAG